MRLPKVSALLLAVAQVAGAQTPSNAPAANAAPANDWKLPGKTLHEVNLDQVRLLQALIGQRLQQAKQKGPLKPGIDQIASFLKETLDRKDWNSAYRTEARLLIRLQGENWTESMDPAASFDLVLSRAIYEPGENVEASLQPLYDSGDPMPKMRGQISLRSADGTDLYKSGLFKINAYQEYPQTLKPKKKLEPGRYQVRYELVGPDGPVLDYSKPFFVVSNVNGRLDQARAASVAADKPGIPLGVRAGIDGVQYICGLIGRARGEYVGSIASTAYPVTARIEKLDLGQGVADPFQPDADLAQVESMGQALAAGKDPLEGRTGDLRLAYRPAGEGPLQPFRLIVPTGYSPAKPAPMVMVLHGAGGDENSLLDRLGTDARGMSVLKRQADTRGYLVVSPAGRSTAPDWSGAAEKDVLDVLDLIQKLYKVSATFLAGHGEGAVGVWNIGFRYPKRFTALAPIAGVTRLDEITLLKFADMPVTFFHAAKDEIVDTQSAMRVVKVAGDALNFFTYNELPDPDHYSIMQLASSRIFEFFEEVRARKRPQ